MSHICAPQSKNRVDERKARGVANDENLSPPAWNCRITTCKSLQRAFRTDRLALLGAAQKWPVASCLH